MTSVDWSLRHSVKPDEQFYFKWQLKNWLWDIFLGTLFVIGGLGLIFGLMIATSKSAEENDRLFKENPEEYCQKYKNTLSKDVPVKCLKYFN